VLPRRKAWSKARAAQLGAGDPSVLRRLGVRAYGLRRGDQALERANEEFEFPVEWGVDVQSEHERYLTEKPVIVMNYAKAIIMIWRDICSSSSSVARRGLPLLRHAAKQRQAPLGSLGSYSHAHRQLENLPSLKQCLVEAVDHQSAMIVGDGKVESVSGP
jgi:hypothetical protein